MTDTSVPARRLWRVVTAALSVWVGAWLWATRGYVLDDTLIHLRFAHFLHETGTFTFDGATPSHGVSSPLYVSLLSVLLVFSRSPNLPKAVSILCYVTLMVLLSLRTVRATKNDRSAWIMLSVVLVSPMAIRWLTDGMETSLAAALACIAGLVVARTRDENSATPRLLAGLAAAGALLVLARIEFATLVAAVAGVEVAGSLRTADHPMRRRARLMRAAASSAGASVGAAGIWWWFGSLIPDTAVAKTIGYQGLFSGLQSIAAAHVGAMSLGCGLAVLWLVTCVRAIWLAEDRWARLVLATVNSVVPAVIAGTIMRGQNIQGFRYFLSFYVFAITMNLVLNSSSTGRASESAVWVRPSKMRRRLIVAGAVALLVVWSIEGARFWRIARDSTHMLHAMSEQHLTDLSEQVGMAYGIGFIAYFTSARICDLNGLVNGRDFARRSPVERLEACWAMSPTFAFLTDREWTPLRQRLASWHRCYSYHSTNAFTNQGQYLFVAPALACPGGSGPPP